MSRPPRAARGWGWALAAAVWSLLWLPLLWPLAANAAVLDDFEPFTGWEAAPSDGVSLQISRDAGPDGAALRLDYDFQGHAGWAAARKAFPMDLPANWELSFRVRGTPRTQNLEVKLLDGDGANVWWSVRRDFEITAAWQRVVVKKRQVSFAWGPAGGGEMNHLGSIELALTAGEGGAGSVWVDDLTFRPLPVPQPYHGTPALTASSSAAGNEPGYAMDGQPTTAWRSAPGAASAQSLVIDFGVVRELGGLVIDWDDTLPRTPFTVELAAARDEWSPAWKVADAHGGRSWVPLGEAEARWVRIVADAPGSQGVGVREVTVKPVDWAETPNRFLEAVAAQNRRGLYPRAMLREKTAWTVVGAGAGTGDPRALLGADGRFEPAPRTYSLEPFVWLDGKLVSWANVGSDQGLLDGSLPIPSVTWHHPAFSLQITALADAQGEAIRYRLSNHTDGTISPRLLLAARPFQVNPPTQFLNVPGGAVPLGDLSCGASSGVTVEGQWRALATPDPAQGGAVSFDGGDVAGLLAAGRLPTAAGRSGRYASAALGWDLELGPGEAADVVVTVVPDRRAGAGGASEHPAPQQKAGAASFADRLQAAARAWRERLTRVEVTVPPAGREVVDTMTASLAYVLVNRDGPALEPGARSYARSWIRDGALMASALLRLGHGEEVKAYARWFAVHQYADGKIPCAVDRRGADPVPENDADGEFIYLVAETFRFTHDVRFAEELWPHVERAVAHLDGLRRQSCTDASKAPEQLAFFGLLPASISHEGYSAQPMHSYWDDFWAVRGFTDATWLAAALGRDDESVMYAAMGKRMRHDLLASLEETMHARAIDYLPGCAELGDFDPTSTTVALAPVGALSWLPRAAVTRTFERYWQELARRREETDAEVTYTPYELRAVGTFVRLGWRERAWELLDDIMSDRTPPGWKQWPEVVRRGQTAARFLGDLPHAWVASDYIRSFLDMLAYERQSDQALVVGAGLPAAWLEDGGVAVRGLRTPWGRLSYRLERDGERLRLHLDPGLSSPPGGVVLQAPLAAPPARVVVNGRPRRLPEGGEIMIRKVPAEVEVEMGPVERERAGADEAGVTVPPARGAQSGGDDGR